MLNYRLKYEIHNQGEPSLLPEVAFSPGGEAFAVSVQEQNEVRLYDTATGGLLRCWRNPDAGFGEPHGVLLTDRYLLVSNRNYFERPSDIRVYRLDQESDYPQQCLITPFPELVEAHSLALSNGRLLVTYCEGDGRTGGVVCYAFDELHGVSGEPLSLVEDCFRTLGDPKGVTFADEGQRALVSFNSLKSGPALQRLWVRILRRWYRNSGLPLKDKLRKLGGLLAGRRSVATRKPLPIIENGLAIFTIDEGGRLSDKPERVLLREEFCRLENVHTHGNTCAIADTINGEVSLYDMASDPALERPHQVITEGLSLPHGVKVSPDASTLVVSNYGLRTWRQEILWRGWCKPRRDSIAVYESNRSSIDGTSQNSGEAFPA